MQSRDRMGLLPRDGIVVTFVFLMGVNCFPAASAWAQSAPPPSADVTRNVAGVGSMRATRSASQAEAKDGQSGALGDAITAVATLLAAAVGFAAAMWVEKRSWERRKAEQIREKQLTTLLSAARFMQQALNRLSDVQAKFSLAGSQSSAANADILRTQASADAKASVLNIESTASELRLIRLELSVLKVDAAAIALLDDALADIGTAISRLRQATTSAYTTSAEADLLAIRIDMSGFIESAISSLRKD